MMSRNLRVAKRMAAIFDGTISLFAIVADLVSVFLMLSVAASVVMRYFFSDPIIWVVEISEYCLLYMTLLASAWLLRGNGHAKMDLVIEGLKAGLPQVAIRISTSLLGAGLCTALFWYGVKVTWDTYKRGLYPSQAVLEIPDAYIMVIIPVALFLLSIQFMRMAWRVWRNWRATRGPEQEE